MSVYINSLENVDAFTFDNFLNAFPCNHELILFDTIVLEICVL